MGGEHRITSSIYDMSRPEGSGISAVGLSFDERRFLLPKVGMYHDLLSSGEMKNRIAADCGGYGDRFRRDSRSAFEKNKTRLAM
jgi:hypothetical protein